MFFVLESYLISSHYDLVTPDGLITSIKQKNHSHLLLTIHIKNISFAFKGYEIPKELISFNLKSSLAQLGLNSTLKEIELDQKNQSATVHIDLIAINELGKKMFPLLTENAYIGKLFAADDRRKVRDPEYLKRMFGRTDRWGKPLLSLGHFDGKGQLTLEKIDGYTIAYIPIKQGQILYDPTIEGFLPIVAKAIHYKNFQIRDLIILMQKWNKEIAPLVKKDQMLLVRTTPLHIRTVFGKVAHTLLPKGYSHTAADILQPNTQASGDIYEFFGSSEETLKEIPLEFYTLEAHREYVFFEDRDQLQANIEDPKVMFQAFKTAPQSESILASIFIIKGQQLINLTEKDWISRSSEKREFPGIGSPARQPLVVEKYIDQQPSYPFLKAIEEGLITSQGILLAKYFPSPLMKRFLLSPPVQRCLKGLYFQHPSLSHQDYFSHEDRAFLQDLAMFGIPVFWVDTTSNNILQYIHRPDKDTGMFVPKPSIEAFRKATFFGVYGSHLLEGNFENEVRKLLQGLLKLRQEVNHPLLNSNTPLALVTGGGAGAMEVGNRIAKELKILSCANIVDFRAKKNLFSSEQTQNPYIEAKMTYRLDRLVERQAEFHLDFPIFLIGGMGMDFEYTLEEVRRKVGACLPTPVILFGSKQYWQEKVSSRFQCNLKEGTIKGSEWVSNCFFCIQTAEQGLEIYQKFFKGELKLGVEGPFFEEGFQV